MVITPNITTKHDIHDEPIRFKIKLDGISTWIYFSKNFKTWEQVAHDNVENIEQGKCDVVLKNSLVMRTEEGDNPAEALPDTLMHLDGGRWRVQQHLRFQPLELRCQSQCVIEFRLAGAYRWTAIPCDSVKNRFTVTERGCVNVLDEVKKKEQSNQWNNAKAAVTSENCCDSHEVQPTRSSWPGDARLPPRRNLLQNPPHRSSDW